MLKPAFQEACRAGLRGAGARHRRRRPRGAGRPALGRGRQALQRRGAARRRADRGGALQGRPAQLRRVRREARVRAGPVAGADRRFAACASACRSARTSGAPTRSNASLETGGEILLVPNASPYERDKLAIRQNVAVARVVESGLPLIYLNQVGGQDELVFDGGSFALNADRSARRATAGLPRDGRAHGLGARRRAAGAASRARASSSRRATRPIMRPACWACATMSTTTAFPAWCSACRAASIRRSARRWRSTRSGADARARGDAALSLHLERIAERRRRLRQGARHPLRHRADRRAGRGRRARAGADVRRPRRATSPRRTSRAARAA